MMDDLFGDNLWIRIGVRKSVTNNAIVHNFSGHNFNVRILNYGKEEGNPTRLGSREIPAIR